MIGFVVLWLAMAGQTIYGQRSYCAYNPRTQVFINCTPDDIKHFNTTPEISSLMFLGKSGECPAHTLCLADSAEHVIEIRVKRDDVAFDLQRTSCPKGYTYIPAHAAGCAGAMICGNDMFVPDMCERVTKTLYIDNQRIGVIREVEEK